MDRREQRRPSVENVEALCAGETVLSAMAVEKQTAIMILHRRGKTTKEIAFLLQLTDRSVARHKAELRILGLL